MPGKFDEYIIEIDFIELIGLYKMALAINHPNDSWVHPTQLAQDEDIGPLSAALQVQLVEIVDR